MALGLYDALKFCTKMNDNGAAGITVAIAAIMTFGLMFFHGNSYRSNMLYYKNKLLAEEDYLNKYIATLPPNSIYIYSRPWQMLAQGWACLFRLRARASS